MNKKKYYAGFASLAMAMSLVGCASQSGPQKNVFTVGINAAMNGVFSPLYYESTYDSYAIDLIYQGLLAYDINQEMQPELAAEMPTISEDGLTYTFKLKEGVKFSDGTDFTSSDVKYTFTVLADPSYTGRFSNYASNIVGYEDYNQGEATELSGIETPDDYTVVFHMKEPRIDALDMLGTTEICSDEQFEYTKGDTSEIESSTDKPIGTGAYQLNSFNKATGASFTKNKEFNQDGKYSIEKIVVKHTETATELDELKSGSIDYIPSCADPSKISQASSEENLTFDTAPGSTIGYFFFNSAQGATSDKAVRQALAYATNRQGFVDAYFSYTDDASDELKNSKLAYVPTIYSNPLSADLGEVVRGEKELPGMNTYAFDLDKANQILDEAGWIMGEDGIRYKDGQKLVVRIMIADGSSSMDTLVPIINKDWKSIGVDLQQNVIDFNTLLSTVGDDGALGNWETSVLAYSYNGLANSDMNSYYHTGESDNYSRISNPELDAALDEGMYTADAQKSQEAYEKAMILANEEAGCIPLYGSNSFNLYNKRVSIKTSSFYDWADAIADASLSE